MRVVVVDGAIGVGKSTVMDGLRALRSPGVAIVDEPVDSWQRTGLLAAMYDGKMSAGQFQIMALSTRALRLVRCLRDPAIHTIVMERSPWSDRHVFAELHLRDEWDVRAYDAIFAEITDALAGVQPHVVLLTAPLDVLVDRVRARGRAQEGGITRAYLADLEARYRAFFAGLTTPKLAVDATAPAREVFEQVRDVVLRPDSPPGRAHCVRRGSGAPPPRGAVDGA